MITYQVEVPKYPYEWIKDSEHHDILAAHRRATELAGGDDCDTEPHGELKNGYYGKKGQDKWQARITVIREEIK